MEKEWCKSYSWGNKISSDIFYSRSSTSNFCHHLFTFIIINVCNSYVMILIKQRIKHPLCVKEIMLYQCHKNLYLRIVKFYIRFIGDSYITQGSTFAVSYLNSSFHSILSENKKKIYIENVVTFSKHSKSQFLNFLCLGNSNLAMHNYLIERYDFVLACFS